MPVNLPLLIGKFTPKQLRDKFGHNLEKLWKEYKLLQPDKTLNRYNSFKGYTVFIDFRKKNYSYQKRTSVKMGEEYRLNLEQIDEFASILLKNKVTAGWIKGLIIHGNAKELYEKDNLHNILE